jgi:TM2 domain-containing membrane protein YozV
MGEAMVGAACSGCGSTIHVQAEICPRCGVRLRRAVAPKSRATAALLAFFLGGLGAHKFYLGKAGMGLLYLLFFWTFIPAFISFIEFIRYLLMSDESFAARYD